MAPLSAAGEGVGHRVYRCSGKDESGSSFLEGEALFVKITKHNSSDSAVHLLGTQPAGIFTTNIKVRAQGCMLQHLFFSKTKNQKQPSSLEVGDTQIRLFSKAPAAHKWNKIDLTLMQGGQRDYWVKTPGVEGCVA